MPVTVGTQDNTDRGTPAAEPTPNAPSDHLAYARLLRQVDLFAGLDRVTLAKLAADLQPLAFKAQTTVFRQDEPGDALYLVANGAVGVYARDKILGTEVQVRVLRWGEPFGEMALLTNNPRTATIKAETDCEVLRLERASFVDLVRQQPSVALSIAATLSHRLAGMLDRPGEIGSAGSDAPTPAADARVAAAVVAARPRWRLGRGVLALAAALIVFAIGWTLPPPTGLPVKAWHALVLLLAALPALVLDVLLEGVLGLLLAGAWVVFGATTPAVALSGFATPAWVLVVSVLVIGSAITGTGLLYRLALGTIQHIRGGFPGEVTALAVAGLLMGPAVPNATSRVIIIAPMLKELVEALGYRAQSRATAGLAMAVLIGFGQMAAMFLTSSTTAVLVASVLPPGTRENVNWLSWMLYGLPVNLIMFVGLLASIFWLYWPSAGERRPLGERSTTLALQRALLGPNSRNEKIALGVGLGLLLAFVTQPLHGVDPAWVAVMAMAVLAATGVVTVDSLRMVNWNFALLFGILISLATVFARVGLDRWIAEQIAAVAGGLLASPLAFIVALVALCLAASLVVRWQAAAPLITIALSPLAQTAGVHPVIVGLIAVIACNAFFLPYQSTTYLALYAGTGGKLFTHSQARPTAFAYAGWAIISAALSVPVWRWMGLL
jgi:anion transporter